MADIQTLPYPIYAMNDTETSAAILEIRRKAGNPGTECPTCGYAASLPFRTAAHGHPGKIAHGCIDAFHSGHLTPGTPSFEWHAHPVAVAFRVGTLKHLSR